MSLVIGRLDYGPCSGSVYLVLDAVGLSNSVVPSKQCVCWGRGKGVARLHSVPTARTKGTLLRDTVPCLGPFGSRWPWPFPGISRSPLDSIAICEHCWPCPLSSPHIYSWGTTRTNRALCYLLMGLQICGLEGDLSRSSSQVYETWSLHGMGYTADSLYSATQMPEASSILYSGVSSNLRGKGEMSLSSSPYLRNRTENAHRLII